MKKEVIVCPVHLGQVALRDIPLHIAASATDPLQQDVGGRLQVDDQIRLRDLLLQDRIELLVDHQLIVAQAQIGEDLVLGEDVVAQHDLVEQVRLRQPLVLPESAEEEEQLALEGRARAILVLFKIIPLCFRTPS